VLQDVSLSVSDGEFLVLVGPSGSGKSTLLRAIAGLDEVDSGDIVIGDKRVNAVPPARRGIAMVFQSYALYPQMSVRENMSFALKLVGKSKVEIDKAVDDAAALLDIAHLLDRRPKALSGGQRQRVAIGRAIVRQPSVFLFDEPLSNLDAALRVRMRYEFARLHKRLTTTIVYVTHDQVEAMTLADRIAVMDHGRVQQLGTPQELYERPASLFVAGFIGSPRMNFIEGQIDGFGAAQARIRSRDGQVLNASVDASASGAGARVTLGVRPEDLVESGDEQAVPAQVTLIEWLGNVRFAYLDSPVADEPLIMQLRPEDKFQEGAMIKVTASPHRCHIFASRGAAFPRFLDADSQAA
jgi:multiple sugar transport system ATP-binding protein